MELRHLRSFVVLAEELHFGRAATRLHIAQPSLSLQLRQLERHVGVQLVARTSHTVRLTPAGDVFRREAQRLLTQLGAAVEATRWAGSGTRGHLRVGFNYPAGQQIVAPALTALHERHPELQTTLLSDHTLGQLAGLRDGRIDVGFVYGARDEPGLLQRPILTVPVVAVCAVSHELAQRGSVTWTDLAPHRCVLPSRSTSPAMYDAITGSARLRGVDLTDCEVFDDGDAASVLIASQEIIVFASRPRAEMFATTGLTTLAVTDPVPQVTVHAVWREADPNPAVPVFLDALEPPVLAGAVR